MKKYLKLCIVIMITIFVGLALKNSILSSEKHELVLDLQGKQETVIQVFYGDNYDAFSEETSLKKEYIPEKQSKVNFYWNSKESKYIRIDFGEKKGIDFSLNSLMIKAGDKQIHLYSEDLTNLFGQSVKVKDLRWNLTNQELDIITTGSDPYIVLDSSILKWNSVPIIQILISYFIAFCVAIMLYKIVKVKLIVKIFEEVYNDKKLIIALTKDDFQARFAGSYFGAIWAFVQPCCTILVFWFVFQIGLRSTPIENYPFLLWLMGGLIPWFFFSEAWSSATNVFLEYAYLVKKMVFKIEILPIVKILSSLITHIFFIVILFSVYFAYGYKPTIYLIQIIYYLICMLYLLIGLCFITSTVMTFFRDLGQILGIVLQFTMWLTPIMWNISLIPKQLIWIFKINPMYYIIDGYRRCMMLNECTIKLDLQTIWFWLISTFILAIGVGLFDKSKHHFADVL